jgi:hypothetical protein
MIGLPGQANQDSAARIGLFAETARFRQPGQNRKERTAGKNDSQNRTAGTGEP